MFTVANASDPSHKILHLVLALLFGAAALILLASAAENIYHRYEIVDENNHMRYLEPDYPAAPRNAAVVEWSTLNVFRTTPSRHRTIHRRGDYTRFYALDGSVATTPVTIPED